MAKLFTNPALLPVRTLPRFVTLQDQARAVRAELALLDGRDMADVDTPDDSCHVYSPTMGQLVTLEAFKTRFNAAACKKRGFRNWKEALFAAWHQGWDDRCEGGHHLRQMRNTAGAHEWLQAQPDK
jgi:hypothetical protein